MATTILQIPLSVYRVSVGPGLLRFLDHRDESWVGNARHLDWRWGASFDDACLVATRQMGTLAGAPLAERSGATTGSYAIPAEPTIFHSTGTQSDDLENARVFAAQVPLWPPLFW